MRSAMYRGARLLLGALADELEQHGPLTPQACSLRCRIVEYMDAMWNPGEALNTLKRYTQLMERFGYVQELKEAA